MRLTPADLERLGADPDGRRVFAQVPASHATPHGRGGEQGWHPAVIASPAPSGVNSARGRSGSSHGDGGEPRRNKYGAIRTVAPASWGGERLCDSKAGAQLARTLDTLKSVGSIVDWFEEVSLPIGVDERGKVIRYRADAMVILGYVEAPDSKEPALVVRFFDRKRGNMDTRTSAAKRAALRNRGLNVEVRT